MCTRFYIDISDKEMQDIVNAAANSALAHRFMVAGDPMSKPGEIYPTNVVPVIASSRSGHRSVFPMKWGYALKGGGRTGRTVSTLLNARSETAGSKPTFRDSWKSHRCIVPASYYFEWEHAGGNAVDQSHNGNATDQDHGNNTIKQKYAIQPKGRAITWLCGLYRIEDGFPHFVVLTRPPSEDIAFIHDRMPLILPAERIDDWIDPAVDAEDLVHYALSDMVFEKAV